MDEGLKGKNILSATIAGSLPQKIPLTGAGNYGRPELCRQGDRCGCGGEMSCACVLFSSVAG